MASSTGTCVKKAAADGGSPNKKTAVTSSVDQNSNLGMTSQLGEANKNALPSSSNPNSAGDCSPILDRKLKDVLITAQ